MITVEERKSHRDSARKSQRENSTNSRASGRAVERTAHFPSARSGEPPEKMTRGRLSPGNSLAVLHVEEREEYYQSSLRQQLETRINRNTWKERVSKQAVEDGRYLRSV